MTEYVRVRISPGDYGRKFEHVLIAENILGRRFRSGEQVHHIDGDGTNNAHENLVICPNYSYHALLHKRQRALAVCGNANWELCNYCKEYSDPGQLSHTGSKSGQKRAYHKACYAAYARKLRKEK